MLAHSDIRYGPKYKVLYLKVRMTNKHTHTLSNTNEKLTDFRFIVKVCEAVNLKLAC